MVNIDNLLAMHVCKMIYDIIIYVVVFSSLRYNANGQNTTSNNIYIYIYIKIYSTCILSNWFNSKDYNGVNIIFICII